MKTSKPSPLLVRPALVICLILAWFVPPPSARAASPPSDSNPMQGWIAAFSQMAPAKPNRVISFSSFNGLKFGSLPDNLPGQFSGEVLLRQVICLKGWYRNEAKGCDYEKISIAHRWVGLSDQEEESFNIYWTFPAFAAVLYLFGRFLAHKLRR